MSLRQVIGGALVVIALPLIASAQTTEETVRTYFSDVSVMADIARCESKFRQFNDAGNVLYGGLGGSMVGVFQINEDVHADFAKSLGMDIYTLDGNLAYAKYLYDREGTQPWISSFPCWGASIDASTTASSVIAINLSLGMENPQVLLLQKTLNAQGYVVSADGPGSPGQETQKFGSLTRAAVRKFQCAMMQICNGDEYSTGYGFIGVKTRAALFGERAVIPVSELIHTTPLATTTSEYTAEERQQIIDLQAQIMELTKVLNALLAAQ